MSSILFEAALVMKGSRKAQPRSMFRRSVSLMACTALVASSLAGCSTQMERIGSDDGTDSCRAQLVALDSTGNYFAEDMLKGAAIGAVSGGLLGGLASGNVKGAVTGAVAGAVAGALGGYWAKMMQQGKDQAILSVVSDMRKDNDQLDNTKRAFNQLSECRKGQAASIKAQYKAKTITRDVAQVQLRQVVARANNDIVVMNKILADSNKRGDEYQYAAAKIDPTIPAPVSASGSGQQASQPAQARVKPIKIKSTKPVGQEFAANLEKRSAATSDVDKQVVAVNGFEKLEG